MWPAPAGTRTTTFAVREDGREISFADECKAEKYWRRSADKERTDWNSRHARRNDRCPSPKNTGHDGLATTVGSNLRRQPAHENGQKVGTAGAARALVRATKVEDKDPRGRKTTWRVRTNVFNQF